MSSVQWWSLPSYKIHVLVHLFDSPMEIGIKFFLILFNFCASCGEIVFFAYASGGDLVVGICTNVIGSRLVYQIFARSHLDAFISFSL